MYPFNMGYICDTFSQYLYIWDISNLELLQVMQLSTFWSVYLGELMRAHLRVELLDHRVATFFTR